MENSKNNSVKILYLYKKYIVINKKIVTICKLNVLIYSILNSLYKNKFII